MLLKLGMTGPAVADLIQDLRRIGFSISAGSVYTTIVKRSVEAFQARKVDSSGLPLVVDGKVGDNTRWALNAELHNLAPQPVTFGLPALPATGGSANGRAALAVALAELAAGHGEVGANNAGPHVRKYLAGHVPEGSSWCAGFVSYCFKEALGRDADFGYITGAQAIYGKMKQLGLTYQASVSNPPQPGDIIVWRRIDPSDPVNTAWQGHVGFVYGFINGKLWTIEGNRGPFPSVVKAFNYSWADLVVSEKMTNSRECWVFHDIREGLKAG